MPTYSQPPTLLDLSSILVSSTFSFSYIEERTANILPQPVQKSIIYHSFPKSESSVLLYASPTFTDTRWTVEQVVQIGFHVSGHVYETHLLSSTSNKKPPIKTRRLCDDYENAIIASSSSSSPSSPPPSLFQPPKFKVSATFDRGKITSVSCTCCSTITSATSSSSSSHHSSSSLDSPTAAAAAAGGVFWCDHVIALSLYRIRKCRIGIDFVLRVPISETLLQLNRSQLQKLVQYLISDHTDVLPTAQRLADEILFMKTDDNYINRIHGAPDPTAGPSPQDPHSWALNTSQIQSQVRQSIITTNPSSSSNIIIFLIEKIYKMISSQDDNANRLLQIITTELVRHSSITTTPTTTKINPTIWDQIIHIWNVIVLKPNLTHPEILDLEAILTPLAHNEYLPESDDLVVTHVSSSEEETTPITYQSIFTTPLNLLQNKANKIDHSISALNSASIHTNTPNIPAALQILHSLRSTFSSPVVVKLENIHILFKILQPTHPKQAYETAIIGLTQTTTLKPSPYTYEKHLKLTEKLINKLLSLKPQYPDLLTTHITNKMLLLNTTTTTTNEQQSSSSFPLIPFAIFVYQSLPQTSQTAYKFALNNLSIPDSASSISSLLEPMQISLAVNLLTSSSSSSPSRLSEISETLTSVVRSTSSLFRLAQEVFKTASSSSSSSSSTESLLIISFNLALHVLKSTKYTVHRRRWDMVRWVVSCGVEIGVSKLFHLVKHSTDYFTTTEAVGTVASNILAWVGNNNNNNNNKNSNSSSGGKNNSATTTASSSSEQHHHHHYRSNPAAVLEQATITTTPTPRCSERGCSSNNNKNKLVGVDKRILEDLATAARNLAIQCAKNDPQNCALNTLTLCESDSISFETAYQIVVDSAAKEYLSPQQIFTIARYMEHRGYTQLAYRLAVIAIQHVHIGYNQDTHSLISEIHWTCNLCHQLSTPPLIIPTTTTTTTTTTSSNNSSSAAAAAPTTPANPSSSRYYPYNQQLLVSEQQQPFPPHHHHHHHHNNNHHHPHHNHPHHHHHHHHYQQPATEIESLIPLLIRNIKCANLLSEILKRSITIMTSYENAYIHHSPIVVTTPSSSSSSSSSSSTNNKKHNNKTQQQQQQHSNTTANSRVYEKLSLLIEGTIDSFMVTITSKLVNISPRHYSDFIEFLVKARETFLLAPNGVERFRCLVENMKGSYKGKKKLLLLLGERFG